MARQCANDARRARAWARAPPCHPLELQGWGEPCAWETEASPRLTEALDAFVADFGIHKHWWNRTNSAKGI